MNIGNLKRSSKQLRFSQISRNELV